MHRFFCLIGLLACFVGFACSRPNGERNLNSLEPRAEESCTPITPSPSNLTCGARGRLQNGYGAPAFDSRVVSSLSECAALCARHPLATPPPNIFYHQIGCYTFSYDESSQVCQPYFADLEMQHFRRKRSSSIVFYNRECFDCPSPCPQELGVNLLENAGLEDSDTSVGPWNQHDGAIVSPGHNSENLFQCTPAQYCGIFQGIPPCPASTYHFSFEYNTSAQRPNVQLGTGTNNDLFFSIPGTGSEWKTYNYWYFADDDADSDNVGRLGLAQQQLFDLQFDNAKLTRVTTDFPTGPEEYVVNGGFENKSLAPWVVSLGGTGYGYSVVSRGINSNRALRITGKPSNGMTSTLIYQQVTGLTQDAYYVLRYDVRKLGPEAQYPDTRIGPYFRASPSFESSSFSYSLPFRATNTSQLLTLQYFRGPILFDNVSIKPLVQ